MVVGGMCNCAHEMPRYTAFKFCLDPTTEQQCALARHAGAAQFAYNQCLAMVKDALDARSTGAAVDVPFTAIDLINGFNEWKKSETAGRMFVVDQRGVAEIGVTGLPWRDQVCQQVAWSREYCRLSRTCMPLSCSAGPSHSTANLSLVFYCPFIKVAYHLGWLYFLNR